ncbi:MAG: ATP-dependent carboxylate-amine ligase [Nitrospirae bacterium]|nr:ATP-dependent carboxylate-amine ligase [Nitrospirota bacterium]
MILTNREDLTADYVVLELQKRAVPFTRLNTEDFPQRLNLSLHIGTDSLVRGTLLSSSVSLPIENIRSVWYRRPSLPSFPDVEMDPGVREFCTKESYYALEGLWASLDVFWVSDPFNIKKAENKPYQLHVASNIGFLIPRTLVSNDPDEIETFFKQCQNGLIVKPVRTGIVHINREEKIIFTNVVNPSDLESLDMARLAPSIYQEMISKRYDIRITVIGNKIFATEIHSQQFEESKVDWRRGENPDIPHRRHQLPSEIEEKCLRLNRTLGLQFSAIDLVLDSDGQYYFLEINPNGQWAWIEERTGYELTRHLVDLLCMCRN